MTTEKEAPFRPYAPLANVVAVLQRLRRMNTPPRITAEFLAGAGVTEALQGRVLAALRFLGLLNDENRPSDTLRALVAAPDDDYLKLLEETVRNAYREDFGNIDPTVDQQRHILNTFQRYTPRSQHERQVMLFLGLCKEVGIQVLDAPRDRAMQDGGTKRPTRSNGRTRGAAVTKGTAAPAATVRPAEGTRAGAGKAGGLFGLVGLVEEDAELLNEEEFAAVWEALGTVVGKVARARARARAPAVSAAPPAKPEEESDDDA
jgi:Family of unknown function (DUF5343)